MSTDSTSDAGPVPFSEAEKDAVYRVIRERRDMRHFTPQPIDPAVLQRLLEAAHHAPSVGLMQPWRFVRILEIERWRKRERLAELVFRDVWGQADDRSESG